MNDTLPSQTRVLDRILDTVNTPVARFRVISGGLARNHTLKAEEDLSGTQACLACGNCVDACPVIASKPEGTMFVRTSMLLENRVADECRRCYKCVAACPQVSKPFKEYVRNHRRIERFSHWDLLASYLVLMSTGILINHWGSHLPEDLRFIAGTVHRIFTISLIAAPILFFLLDRHHFMMAARKTLAWAGEDMAWLAGTWKYITSFGKSGIIKRGAFNPGQRFWYLFVPIALVVFACTGSLKWLGPQVIGQANYDAATTVHVLMAWTTDILMVLHIWLKIGWPILRDTIISGREYFDLKERQSKPAIVKQR